MKKYSGFSYIMVTCIVCAMLFNGCGEKKNKQAELIIGNWEQLKNKTHILLVINPAGEWESVIRIPDAGSKIVKSKGSAKGTWHIEKGLMRITVAESDVEDVWTKNGTASYHIMSLKDDKIQLKDESGHVAVWTRTLMGQDGDSKGLNISMAPVAVNINKNRSNEKDRYLCLKMKMILRELMPGQKAPPVHPKVNDAVITFFSSLLYDDVKDFAGIKVQNQKLLNILNPLMEGMIKEIAVEHVIVTAEIEKVEEFMITRAEPAAPAPGKGKEAKDGKKEEKPKH
jgi:Flagellar basal body-associated protein FliL